MIFLRTKRKTRLQYTGTLCLRTVTKKHTTRKNLVMCGNHAFEILPPTCCVPPKVPFPYKTLCPGMQFDREIVEHEPGLGGVGEGG